eukprot:1145447-Pelagomonas_calceolata.AAC.8
MACTGPTLTCSQNCDCEGQPLLMADASTAACVEAAKWQHADLCKNLSGKAVILQTILLGVGGT